MSSPLIGVSISALRLDPIDYQAILPSYPHAVAAGGALPALIPLGLDESSLRALFDRLDGIVLTGGGDVDPRRYNAEPSPYTISVIEERDRIELLLTRWAIDADKPLLAICRGLQILNVALGGTLVQDILAEIPTASRHDAPGDDYSRMMHTVDVIPGSKLHAALGGVTPVTVNSLHHQALKTVASPLEITACAPDGIIEGVEYPDRRFIVGVQWHPEAMVDHHPQMLSLFQSLTHAAFT